MVEKFVSVGGVEHPVDCSVVEMLEKDEVLRYFVFHPTAMLQFQLTRAVVKELNLSYTDQEIAQAVIRKQERTKP